MPKLNPQEIFGKLDAQGQEFAEKLLTNSDLIDLVNQTWENPNITKLNWKQLKQKATGATPEKKSNREGYYSILFLEKNGEREPYLIAKEIAKGGKAFLKNAYNLRTGEHVALKIVRGVTEDSDQEYKREIEGLSFLKRYKGKQEREKKQYLAQDFIRGMDVDKFAEKYLQDKRMSINSTSPECLGFFKTVLQVIVTTLFQVKKLHQEGYVHRDLKGGNLMVLENLKAAKLEDSKVSDVLVIDFGSMDKELGALRSQSLGTKSFFPPEFKDVELLGFNQNSDSYAIGLVVKNLVSYLKDQKLKIYFIKKNKELLPDYELIVKKLDEIAEKMTLSDFSQRMCTREAYTEVSKILASANPAFSDILPKDAMVTAFQATP